MHQLSFSDMSLSFAVVGADTIGVEVSPSTDPECSSPLHIALIRDNGIYFIELLELDALAGALSIAGRRDFLLVVNPLPLHQAVGSPLTPTLLSLLGFGSVATIQRRLARLKRLGIVRQTRSRHDKRRIELTLSPKDLRIRALLDYAAGPLQEDLPAGYVPLHSGPDGVGDARAAFRSVPRSDGPAGRRGRRRSRVPRR